MARKGKKNGHKAASIAHRLTSDRHSARPAARWHSLFTRFAQRAAKLAGSPLAFIAATTVVLIWAASGSLFGYSDTWQLVINTGTTIVTFLMVFLIQSTQNRDTMAVQIKLAELIIKLHGARNGIAAAEELSDEELESLHREYRTQADAMMERLERRRARA